MRKMVVEVTEKRVFDVPVVDWFGETKRIRVQMDGRGAGSYSGGVRSTYFEV